VKVLPSGRTNAKVIACIAAAYIVFVAGVWVTNLVLWATVPQFARELFEPELFWGPAITVASYAVLFGIIYWIVRLFAYNNGPQDTREKSTPSYPDIEDDV